MHYHPDTIADLSLTRRSAALKRLRTKISRCEKLLIAAHYLIEHAHKSDLEDYKLVSDIKEEIGQK